MTENSATAADAFIARWREFDASERANAQSFLNDLIDLLGVPRPDNAGASGYRYEYKVTFPRTGTPGFIDLYKRGHFVLEAKRGAAAAPAQLPLLPGAPPTRRPARPAWDDAMVRARGQAEAYARALPDEYPPFLVTVAVGQATELWADFSRTGKNYSHFPDARRFRIALDDLRDDAVRDRLRLVWSDPDALDPARTAARVTRQIADRLAALGRSFEAEGHPPDKVANFLMRCLFSMFAEDVRLIPEDSFRDLLNSQRGTPESCAQRCPASNE